MTLRNINDIMMTNMLIPLVNLEIINEKSNNLINYEGGYDFDDCCCGGTCSCGSGNYRIDLDKMVGDENFLINEPSYSTTTSIFNVMNNNDIDLINPEYIFTSLGIYNGIIQFLFLSFFFVIIIKRIFYSFNYIRDNNTKSKLLDAPVSWGLYFQDAASPSFEGVVDLHNRIMFYLVVILFGVSWVLLSVIYNFNKKNNKLVYRHLNHGKYVPILMCSKFKNTI